MFPSPSSESDLDWQAFAYWADELSAAERARFEALLEDDQAAREALARVVELSHAVIAAESLAVEPVARKAASPSRRVFAWTAGLTASALALLLGFLMGQNFDTHSSSNVVRPIDPDLASIWSDIRSNWGDIATSQQLASVELAKDVGDFEDAGGLEDQTGTDWDASDLETPSWMTAALLNQPAAADDAAEGLPDSDSVPGESSTES
jgi:hypothetical protein